MLGDPYVSIDVTGTTPTHVIKALCDRVLVNGTAGMEHPTAMQIVALLEQIISLREQRAALTRRAQVAERAALKLWEACGDGSSLLTEEECYAVENAMAFTVQIEEK